MNGGLNLPHKSEIYRMSYRPKPYFQIEIIVPDPETVYLNQEREDLEYGGVTIVLHPDQIECVVKWMLEAKTAAFNAMESKSPDVEPEILSE